MSKRILLVEDDESLGFVTKDNLESRGYKVFLCVDGEQATKTYANQKFDLCLIDIMLPKLDGFSLAEIIRAKDKIIPIIFLTAKSMQEDKLKGFKIGGDDYVTKPFSIEELIYRIESCLKRSAVFTSSNAIINIGTFLLDCESFMLRHKRQNQKLTRRETEIIQYLSDRSGSVVTREEILLALWGDNDYFKGRSLDVFISKIRRYLKIDTQVDIENYHGVGFKLIVRK